MKLTLVKYLSRSDFFSFILIMLFFLINIIDKNSILLFSQYIIYVIDISIV